MSTIKHDGASASIGSNVLWLMSYEYRKVIRANRKSILSTLIEMGRKGRHKSAKQIVYSSLVDVPPSTYGTSMYDELHQTEHTISPAALADVVEDKGM